MYTNSLHPQSVIRDLKLMANYWTRPTRMLGLRVRIRLGAWKSVSGECCVLSGRGLCDVLITRLEESYRVWCVWVWYWSLVNEKDLANWWGCCATKKKMCKIGKDLWLIDYVCILFTYRTQLLWVWQMELRSDGLDRVHTVYSFMT